MVPPGLSGSELSTLAGSVLYQYRRIDTEDVPIRLRPLIAALLWRAARLVVMGERGAGAATRHDLERCGEAVYRHLGLSRQAWAGGAFARAGAEIEYEIDRALEDFFSGPSLPLALLVERLAPELGPGPRTHVASILEELIRDLADLFATGRHINRP